MKKIKNLDSLIHGPPKFKKGDIIRLDWDNTHYEFYKINGVRSSKIKGLCYYLTEILKCVGYKYPSNFKKPYNYNIDERSRLATKKEINILKSQQLFSGLEV